MLIPGYFCKLFWLLKQKILKYLHTMSWMSLRQFICLPLHCFEWHYNRKQPWVMKSDAFRSVFSPTIAIHRHGFTRMVLNWINHFTYASSVKCTVLTYIIQKNAWNITQLSHVEHQENCPRRRDSFFEKRLGFLDRPVPHSWFGGNIIHNAEVYFGK